MGRGLDGLLMPCWLALCSSEGPRGGLSRFSGGYSEGETPLPIPNRAVKPLSADGTWPARAWESRTPPVSSLDPKPPSGAASSFSRRPIRGVASRAVRVRENEPGARGMGVEARRPSRARAQKWREPSVSRRAADRPEGPGPRTPPTATGVWHACPAGATAPGRRRRAERRSGCRCGCGTGGAGRSAPARAASASS